MKNKTDFSEIFLYVIIIVGIAALFVKTYYYFNERVNRITCDTNRQTLHDAVERYRAYKEDEVVDEKTSIIDVEFLRREKFIQVKITCPEKGIYKLNERGRVYCTFHQPGAGGERK